MRFPKTCALGALLGNMFLVSSSPVNITADVHPDSLLVSRQIAAQCRGTGPSADMYWCYVGELNVVTSPSPFLTWRGCQYIFEEATCYIRIYCPNYYGQMEIRETIGCQQADCTPPNYGRLVFQDIGELYIARNDDPYQILFQTNTGNRGAEKMWLWNNMPFMGINKADGGYLWMSHFQPPIPPDPPSPPCPPC